MRISPLDIRQQQFTVKTFRGFDPHEVDAFLDDVADDYETVIKENGALKEQLAVHEERARSVADLERTLKDTLLATQRATDEMKMVAKREADLLIRDAELHGEKLLEQARGEEAIIKADIHSIRRLRREVLEDLRSVLDRYHRLLSGEEAGEADDGKG